MRKYLFPLLAACCLVACDEADNETTIDFSALTHEELLATEGGLEYLVSQGESFDRTALNERLSKEVLLYFTGFLWYYENGKWHADFALGDWGAHYYVMADEGTMRKCAERYVKSSTSPVCGYWSIDFQSDPLEAILTERGEEDHEEYQVIAYCGKYVVFERQSQVFCSRYIATFEDTRSKMLDTYSVDFSTIPPSEFRPCGPSAE